VSTPAGSGAPSQSISATQKLNAFGTLFCVWREHLTESETMLLGWLIANTINRGKTHGFYYTDQILNGIDKDDGSGRWTGGVGFKRSTLFTVVKSLKEKGVLFAEARRAGILYAVNLQWMSSEEETNVVKFPAKPRTAPKRAALWVDNEQEEQSNIWTEQSNSWTHSIRDHLLEETKGRKNSGDFAPEAPPSENLENQKPEISLPSRQTNTPSPAPSPVSLRDKIADLTAQSPKSDKPLSYEATWAHALKEAFPATPAVQWTRKEHGMVKAKFSKWHAVHGKPQEFLQWSVLNWRMICERKLRWMTKSRPPECPDIQFLVNFMKHFLDGWLDREHLQWTGTLKGTDKEIQTLVNGGMSFEAATLEVANTRAVALMREKNEKALGDAQRLYRMADLAKKQAQQAALRAPRFTPKEEPLPEYPDTDKPWGVEEIDWDAARRRLDEEDIG
jgi:hypothetical protein